MNFLCRMGVHKWRPIPGTFGSLMYPLPIQKCQRCGLMLKHYTPECSVTFRADEPTDG